ncbi:hypothetical protein PR048_023823 [Dryococelus australis]|uniref:Uncharacterized protein n=1 Tax=Dryococelus australis TaxID=614101 RepID=A0ABQ9GV52_9NEOP|nr:hypothetical protein PR048_023823 [Dryococelus australis]
MRQQVPLLANWSLDAPYNALRIGNGTWNPQKCRDQNRYVRRNCLKRAEKASKAQQQYVTQKYGVQDSQKQFSLQASNTVLLYPYPPSNKASKCLQIYIQSGKAHTPLLNGVETPCG